MKVAFLGLGIMGSRMARHLKDAGHDITVWNRSKAPREAAAKDGLATAATTADALADADVVVTMLANPDVVRHVMLEGGLEEMKSGAIWADSSTVNPSFAVESARASEAAGIRYLGAPVAGTRIHAQNKELKVLVGGPENTLSEARPVLEAFSQAVIHVGPEADRGAAFKILINGMLAQSMALFNETLRIGEAQGLNREFLLKVMPGLPVIAPFVGAKVDMIRAGRFDDVSFPLEHMHKDVNLLVQTAYEVGEPAPMASTVREIYGRAKQSGKGRLDFSAV